MNEKKSETPQRKLGDKKPDYIYTSYLDTDQPIKTAINSMVQGVFYLAKLIYNMFDWLNGCIDKFNVIDVYSEKIFTNGKKIYLDLFNVNNPLIYVICLGILWLLMKAFFKIKEKKENGFEFENIVPIPYVKWTDYHDEVTIRFSPEIMPYLINLKKNFTQHALSDISELNSKYSIILYRWLSMNYNQYEHYSYKGGRREEQVEAYRNPSISIRELREMTDTVNEFKRFYDFEKWILRQPLEEINDHTSFNVTYDKIKKGRSIDSIVFHITKKHVAKNENYKQEQQDPAYLSGKANKEQEQQKIFAEAMQSEYTKILLENNLLFPTDFMDLNTMAELQRLVYPLYDQLKEKKGITQIEKHLSYVAGKQEDYSKRNIVKYLQTAIKQYLETQ